MEGWFHPTAHVWLYTNNGKALLQKRAAEKDTFPGLWDVSVAGHVHAGETPMEAALREVKEELDMELDSGSLHFLGRFKSEHSHPGGILDRSSTTVICANSTCPLKTSGPNPKRYRLWSSGPYCNLQKKSGVLPCLSAMSRTAGNTTVQ